MSFPSQILSLIVNIYLVKAEPINGFEIAMALGTAAAISHWSAQQE
jgi:hypothetical protein